MRNPWKLLFDMGLCACLLYKQFISRIMLLVSVVVHDNIQRRTESKSVGGHIVLNLWSSSFHTKICSNILFFPFIVSVPGILHLHLNSSGLFLTVSYI